MPVRSNVVTITVLEKEVKYRVALKFSGFDKPPYVSVLVNVGTGDSRKELPVTVETTGYLRVSEIRVYTRRTYEGYCWQYETGRYPKWIFSKESYPAPDVEVTRITFRDYSVNLTYKDKRVSDHTLTVLGVSSDGSVTLRFAVKRFGYREVSGEIVESDGTIRFRWKCPVCGKVNENTEDRDRLEYLDWKVAEMCKKCDVQSYVVLK